MEELTQVARSLSPYVVISLEGDPIKTHYASTWAQVSPMPNVWVKRFVTDEKAEIIANIWDIPSGRDKSAIMIPDSRVDHCIIFYDLTYRSMSLSEKGHTRDLEVFIRENKGKGAGTGAGPSPSPSPSPGPGQSQTMQVIIHGRGSGDEEAEAIKVCRSNNVVYIRQVDVDYDIIKKICYRVYSHRAAAIDNQIKSILNANK
jgi:hypothetical protein